MKITPTNLRKIKDWLIHKLGGVSKEEIFPPPMYTVENPKVEKFGTYFIDKNTGIPKEYIIDKLTHGFLPMIKENMKVTKEINGCNEICYRAKIRIVKGGVRMAVIIEQEGQPNYKRVKCNCCNSILKYLNVDEKQENHIDGYFGPETIAYIICPNCGDKVLTWAMCATDFADYRIK